MSDFTKETDVYAEGIKSVGIRADEQVKALEVIVANQENKINELQAYKDAHPDTEPEPPVDPPITEPAFMKVGTSIYRESGETPEQAYARRAKNWGAPPELVRYFWSGYPGDTWPKFGNAQIVTSFKPTNINDYIAGNFDSALDKYFDLWPQDKIPKRISAWHEEEDDIEEGHFNFDLAKKMDTKTKQLADAANKRNPGLNLRVGKVFMAYTLDAASGRNINNYMPDGWQFDWLGWDCYSGDNDSLDLPGFTGTKVKFARCREASNQFGAKSWFICETGTRNHVGDPAATYDGKQAQWITGAVDIAADLGCRGFMYFDSTVGGDFRILGPKGFAAMGAAIKK